jgi:hypothetical protein
MPEISRRPTNIGNMLKNGIYQLPTDDVTTYVIKWRLRILVPAADAI